MRKHNEHLKRKNIYTDVSKEVASWLPTYRRWTEDKFKKGEPLAVYFMNKVPSHWKYGDNQIFRNYIMEVAQGDLYWKNCFTVDMDINEAHIRVKFHGETYILLLIKLLAVENDYRAREQALTDLLNTSTVEKSHR